VWVTPVLISQEVGTDTYHCGMGSGDGPGRIQQWLIFRAPEVLLVIGIVGLLVGGVAVLATNPANLHTQADQPYGSDAPMQASNVALAVGMFVGAAALALFLGWRLWRRATTRGY
jgi:hypothetical protein